MDSSQRDEVVFDKQFKSVSVVLFISFVALSYSLSMLPETGAPPPGYELSDRTCITGGRKRGLIMTHILAFVLIPFAMRVFYTSLEALHLPKSSIFASQLGLAFIMVAIAAEIGWHVTQCWYYVNQYTMLNFLFYFFLLSAFALWSNGLVHTFTALDNWLNGLFALFLIIVSVLYPIGAATDNGMYKVPIYIALTVIFAVLTFRAYVLLEDWKVIFFPIFSVVVNLFFVFLLQKYGGNPYDDVQELPNAFYHIAHDLLGTEAGVLIFTVLVYQKGRQVKMSGEGAPLLGEARST